MNTITMIPFIGDKDNITEEQIKQQIIKCLIQKESGNAIITNKFPDSNTRRIDVTKLLDII
jgi:hypothetical protein